jgi:FlaA1/EpsC-like NDP-sugar epimerase
MLDQCEVLLYQAEQELIAAGAGALITPVVADVADAERMEEAFVRFRPALVLHAAAHKHVPILERHACEAVRTTVLGTVNVVDAARRVNATHFVAISTDKAADPSSVMGATKWLAEQVVLTRSPVGLRYCAVRFGNVAGSRGSVIPTFQRQIAAGGPVTVTDPRMTRWFMSIDEAVRLVLQAAAARTDHVVLALKMGEQVNVHDLAERMIRLVGRRPGADVEIVVTGIRPGEKLAEEMVGPGESMVGEGPILGIVPVVMSRNDLDRAIDRLSSIVDELDDDAARAALAEYAAPAIGDPARRDASSD